MFSLFTSLCLLATVFSGSVELTPDDFDSVVDGSKNVFVMFYAPWCGHCKQFKPEYEKVATSFANYDNVVIAKVDADAHRDLGERYGVKGFPTLKYFPAGSTEATDFTGGRSDQGVVDFINKEAGTDATIYVPPSAVTVLTEENFNSIQDQDALVEFYAPWCGHCKRLAPTYEEVATAFQGESGVTVAKVDATVEEALASQFGVKGYPTLKWFPKGSLEAEDYEGGRTLQNFVDYINRKANTRRNTDGTLKRSYGRFPELDEMAQRYLATPNRRGNIREEFNDYCIDGELTLARCTQYLKYLDKIDKKGDDANAYVTKEIARLENLSRSDSVDKGKRDNFQLRSNILRGFLEGPEDMGDEEEGSEDQPKEDL